MRVRWVLEDGAIRMGLHTRHRRASSLSLRAHTEGLWVPSEMATTCEPREEVGGGNRRASTLIWVFPASRALRNTFLLFKSPKLWYFVTASWVHKETKTEREEERMGKEYRAGEGREISPRFVVSIKTLVVCMSPETSFLELPSDQKLDGLKEQGCILPQLGGQKPSVKGWQGLVPSRSSRVGLFQASPPASEGCQPSLTPLACRHVIPISAFTFTAPSPLF